MAARDDVKELFQAGSTIFDLLCKSCTINGHDMDLAHFLEMKWLHEVSMVRLRVLQA